MIPIATSEQITEERAIFNEAWRILKQYYNLQHDSPDSEWEALIAEADTLSKMPAANNKSRLSKDIALAVLTHVETLVKERKGNT